MSMLSLVVRPELAPHRPQAKLAQYLHVYVAPASTGGLGLFTARPLAKGDVALRVTDARYLSRAMSRSQLVWQGYTHADIFQVGPDLFIPPYGGPDDFTNHSCDPTCGLRVGGDGFSMLALRDLPAGTELTYDYSTHQEHGAEDMECLCGSPLCRGVVRSFSTLPEPLRRRYAALGVVAPFALAAAGMAPGGH